MLLRQKLACLGPKSTKSIGNPQAGNWKQNEKLLDKHP